MSLLCVLNSDVVDDVKEGIIPAKSSPDVNVVEEIKEVSKLVEPSKHLILSPKEISSIVSDEGNEDVVDKAVKSSEASDSVADEVVKPSEPSEDVKSSDASDGVVDEAVKPSEPSEDVAAGETVQPSEASDSVVDEAVKPSEPSEHVGDEAVKPSDASIDLPVEGSSILEILNAKPSNVESSLEGILIDQEEKSEDSSVAQILPTIQVSNEIISNEIIPVEIVVGEVEIVEIGEIGEIGELALPEAVPSPSVSSMRSDSLENIHVVVESSEMKSNVLSVSVCMC